MLPRTYFNEALCHPETSFETLQRLLSDPQWDPNSNINGVNGVHIALDFPIQEALRRIELFLTHGADVNAVDKKYELTPLFKLVGAGINEKTIQFLKLVERLKIKLDYNLPSTTGTTPLLMAAKTRNELMALHLLNMGGHEVDVKAQDNIGDTALHYACSLGMPSLVIALMQWGASTFHRNNVLLTPLDFLDMPKTQVIKILKSVHLDPERDEYARANLPVDKNGQALVVIHTKTGVAIYCEDICAKKSNKAELEALIKENVVVNSDCFTDVKVRKGGFSIYGTFKNQLVAEEKAALLDQFDEMSGISLVDACLLGHVTIRNAVLRQNIFHPWILRDAAMNNDPVLVVELLTNKALIRCIDDPSPLHGRSALHVAAEKGHPIICKILLDRGANPLLRDSNDHMPIQLAIMFKKKDAFLLLVDKLSNTFTMEQWRELYRFIRLQGEPSFAHLLSQRLSSKSASFEQRCSTLQIEHSLFKLRNKLLGVTGDVEGCKPVQRVPTNRRKPSA